MRCHALLQASCMTSLVLTTVSAEQVQFYRKSEQFGLALSTASTSNGSEVYIHIQAPASNQWAAIGTGDAMDGSLMFVMSPEGDGDGDEVTLSVRSAHGHHEPDEVDINVDILSLGIENGVMQAKAKWKLHDTSAFSKVDVASRKQPWIWAVGPSADKGGDTKEGKRSRSPENELQEHSSYGIIFADMTKAAQEDDGPPQIQGTVNVSTKPQGEAYHALVVLHALLLGIAFVVVFPLGVMGLRYRWKLAFKVHWLTQGVASLASFVGLAVAIALSIVGVEFDDFSQAHQILGICVVALLTVQIVAGYWHHVTFKRYGRRAAVSYAHIVLGRIAIYGGMINSILGFELAVSNSPAIGSAVVALVFAAGMEYMALRHKKRVAKTVVTDMREGEFSSSEFMLSDNNNVRS